MKREMAPESWASAAPLSCTVPAPMARLRASVMAVSVSRSCVM
jgi:hypothetical protein